ncbi:MAG: FAD:protein FMN transferase [Opitutus sp.]|nr:FAD:protein FMN transferase [Opitutus sp.]
MPGDQAIPPLPPMSLSAAPLPAAGMETRLRRLAFTALGTNCEVRFHAPDAAVAERFAREARAWVGNFEARYSRFRPASLLSRINASAGSGTWIGVDAEMEAMLDVCQATHQLTGGILDATAGPLLKLWDYKIAHHSLPDPARIAATRALVGWGLVERRPGAVRLPRAGMALDFGGWGKEWAVDAVAALAGQLGVREALIDFGHDIRGLGRPPGRPAWHVGLEDPDRPGSHHGSIAVHGGRGVASSGDYRRHFTLQGRRYGHIVDPRTGWPTAHEVRQVTVIADTCFQAGLLSTTAFILGPAAGRDFIARFPGAEGVIVTTTGRIQTKGFWSHVVT